MAISIVGFDLSKSVFQLSLADAKHHVVDRKRLSRAQFHRFLAQTEPVRLVMEACGTSHYWGRTAQSLGQRSSYGSDKLILPGSKNLPSSLKRPPCFTQ